MAILVTGGAGYIGSVTTELLRARGEQVVVLDNLSRGHRAAVAPDVPFYEGNVGNSELVTRIVREHDVDACIHFAAFAYVGESVIQPALYYENNVEQGIRLLGALKHGGRSPRGVLFHVRHLWRAATHTRSTKVTRNCRPIRMVGQNFLSSASCRTTTALMI